MGEIGSIVFVLFLIGFIFLMRLLGAWMLRINEVIEIQKQNIQLQKELLEAQKLQNLEIKKQTLEIINKL